MKNHEINNNTIDQLYDELKHSISYLTTLEDKASSTYMYSLEYMIDRICDAHKKSVDKNDQLEKKNAEHKKTIDELNKAFFENRSLWKTKYEQAVQENEQLHEQLDELNKAFEEFNEKYAADYKQLKEQLKEKDAAIDNWETMYEGVVKTCNNDMKEINRLNDQLKEKEAGFEKLKELKAKEVSEVLADVLNQLTGVLSQKINAADILDFMRRTSDAQNNIMISKLEEISHIVNHICQSPDNERAAMMNDLTVYLNAEIAGLKGDK